MPNKLRQAVGVVKDQTSIGLARISGAARRRSNSSKLDVAVVKATSHDELLPFDDRRATEVLLLLAAYSPTAAAVDLVAALRRRVSRTRSWVVVVLKALSLTHHILIARAPFFASELRRRGSRVLVVLDLSGGSSDELGEFVRAFARFIETRLQFFASSAADQSSPELAIERVVSLQRLLDRAMAMRPMGQATSNRLVQTSLYPVVRESFDVYREVSGLLDDFLELKFQSCVETFRACAKANKQFHELSSFYKLCRKIGVGRQPEYPKLENISRSLLKRMEEFLSVQQAASSPPTIVAGARRASDRKEEEEEEGEEGEEGGWEAILVESVNSMTRSSRRSSLEELLKSSPWSCTNPFRHPAAANPFSGEVSQGGAGVLPMLDHHG